MNHRKEMKKPCLRILAASAICLAAVGGSSCSYCWPSLHTAEAVRHCDKQVVVWIPENLDVKYRYKGEDWHPVMLAYAIDKGERIYRRGDGAGWCLKDNTNRYQIQQESVRTFMIPRDESQASPYRASCKFCFDRAIAEMDFPFDKAVRINSPKDEPLPISEKQFSFGNPCWEISTAVASMPITGPAPQPSTMQRLAAAPLEVVDTTATIAMRATELAFIIVILPPSAVWNGITKLING